MRCPARAVSSLNKATMNYIGSICITDIPQEFARTGKDGKKYLPIYIGQRRQPSQYGHTHFIKVYIPKDRREEGVEHYIGEMKPSEYESQQTQIIAGAEAFAGEQDRRQLQSPPSPVDEAGDLPF